MRLGAYFVGQESSGGGSRGADGLQRDLRGVDAQPCTEIAEETLTECSVSWRAAVAEPCKTHPFFKSDVFLQINVKFSQCSRVITMPRIYIPYLQEPIMNGRRLPWVSLVRVPRLSTTRPEDESPPQTPNSSVTAGAGQQRPPASRLPAQQAPVKSTVVALPPHTPHASSRPLLQHWPERSSVAVPLMGAAQHAPPSLTTPAPPVH